MSTRVTLSSLVYPRECVEEAVSAYSAICSVDVYRETQEGLDVDITAREDTKDEGRAVNEFLNYLLDLSLEKHLTSARI
jgi:hypothetical protein